MTREEHEKMLKLEVENAQLKMVLLCKECEGKGWRGGITQTGAWTNHMSCPVCGPLRKKLKEGE